MLNLDFGTNYSSEQLHTYGHPPGCARVIDGVLQLTAGDYGQTGSAIVHMGDLGSLSAFVAEFDVYIGGGLGGEGLSFNVGVLPPTHFGERGARSGVSVQLLISAQLVEVWYGNALLARSSFDLDQLAQWFTHVMVTVNGDGLSVEVGGVAAVLNATLVGWSPTDSWRMGFGARTGATQNSVHLVDNVLIRTGSAYQQHVVPLGLRMNGQQISEDAVSFSFYAEPTVSSLRFERGPTSGGTSVAIDGSSFRGGSLYRCRFDAAVVNATYSSEHDELRCLSPMRGAAGDSVVEVSLNGQQFTRSGVTYVYYELVVVSHVVPSAGPRTGGTVLTVIGAGFAAGRDFRCRFEGSPEAVVFATFESDGSVLCTTPPSRCGAGSCTEVVEVSLNSESYSSSGVLFTFYNMTIRSLDVSSGPSSGGTMVTIHGTGFTDMARVETLCAFSEGVAVASYIDETRVRCASPRVDAVSWALSFEFEFDFSQDLFSPTSRTRVLPASTSVHVGFEIAGSLFRYSALFTPEADPRAFTSFIASFLLLIDDRGMHGDETLSFCAGSLSAPFLDPNGGDALCAHFEHGHNSRVRLERNGVSFAELETKIPPVDSNWFSVNVVVLHDRVSVQIDGSAWEMSASLVGWRPSSGFRFGFFAAAGGQLRSRHLVDDVYIMAGSLLNSSAVPVEIALNGQQFETSEAQFYFLSEPHLRSVSPTAGPGDGGTLIALRATNPAALALTEHVMCIFANVEIIEIEGTWDGTLETLRCSTPPSTSAGPMTISASTQIAGHRLSSGMGVIFTYHPPFELIQMTPASGPTEGGTEVVVAGRMLTSAPGPVLCRIGNYVLPATVELRRQSLRCRTPALSTQSAQVEISLNGQQYQGDSRGSFHFYSPPAILSVVPASGTALGSSPVTISGTGFLSSLRGVELCRWGNATTNVTFVNETHIICLTPAAAPGLARLEVAINGQQYTADSFNFSWYSDPHVRSLSWPGTQRELNSWLEPKITLPNDGFVLVRAWGTAFMGGTDYRCRINDEDPIQATYDAMLDSIMCLSDLWIDGPNTVEVTLNGQEYTSDNATFTYVPFW